MKIGIDISAAFKSERTGVEEYVFKLIENIAKLQEAKEHEFVLYVRSFTPGIFGQNPEKFRSLFEANFGMHLSPNFKLVPLYSPFFWRTLRLALHLLRKRPDVLFMPAHVLPLFSPKHSVVMIHGLEYERYPQFYSRFSFNHLRKATRYSSKKSIKIITPSESTKNDLIMLYQVQPFKIQVVHHGVDEMKKETNCSLSFKYILYIGRLELKKNVQGLLEVFDLLKREDQIPHKLMLVGPEGFGSELIKEIIDNHHFKKDIIVKGHISEEEKIKFMSCADLLAMPSFYEGFGLPVLEAQKLGIPVMCSGNSALVEIVGEGGVFVNSGNIINDKQKILEALTNEEIRQRLIRDGKENVKKYTWTKCAKETLDILLSS